MSSQQPEDVVGKAGLMELWTGVLLAPIAWWLHLEIDYTLVPFSCTKHSHVSLYLVTLGALALAAVGFFIAWRNWRVSGRQWPNAIDGGPVARTQLMAIGGLLSSGMFFMAILAQGITSLMLSPCQI
jgi:hypothetical protein